MRISFATAFGAWRRREGIPLKKIADELGVSLDTVSKWELGNRFPSVEHFQALVNYTGIPPCRLFCIMADKCVPADCLLALRQQAAPPPRSLPRVRLKVEN
jgi:transcriptional regulator with XRE-family HTH domain